MKIPDKIKSKVKDKDWNLDFIFEDMNCNHTQGAKEYERVHCDKCKFDKREVWLEQTLEAQDPNEKTSFKDDKGKTITQTLSKITVIRGIYDDVIGIQKEFE